MYAWLWLTNWMDYCIYVWMRVCTYGWMDVCTCVWMNARLDEWRSIRYGCIHVCMDPWMDEWMYECVYVCMCELMGEWINACLNEWREGYLWMHNSYIITPSGIPWPCRSFESSSVYVAWWRLRVLVVLVPGVVSESFRDIGVCRGAE